MSARPLACYSVRVPTVVVGPLAKEEVMADIELTWVPVDEAHPFGLRCPHGPIVFHDDETLYCPECDSLKAIEVNICPYCLNGAGGECHYPGCVYWMKDAPTGALLGGVRELVRWSSPPDTSALCQDCGDIVEPFQVQPVPMRLPCPSCGELHVDEGEFATKEHHTHACQFCGQVWRPALISTVGVRFLPGFKDDEEAELRPLAALRSRIDFWAEDVACRAMADDLRKMIDEQVDRIASR